MYDKKQSGSDASDDTDKTSKPEQKEAEKEEQGFKRGGHKRKRGGMIHGKRNEPRPDRRARGGNVGHNPVSSAGDMSSQDYEKGHRTNNGEEAGGKGDDKNARGVGYARGGKLTAADRKALPSGDFALPGRGEGPNGKGSGSYPINDPSHARNALARVSQHGSPEEKAEVRRRVHQKFPGIGE